jgi:AcrR family transcriptional regulator
VPLSRARRRGSGPPEPADQLRPDTGAARERLLVTAYALFQRHGVNAVGVDRIVAEAGVAKTTLYRHFQSKDELVVAVLERHEQLWLGWLKAEIERRGSSPEARILAVFDALDDWFHQSSYEGCLLINTLLESHDRDGRIWAAATEKLANIHALLRGLAHEAGLRDPDAFAHEIQMLMFGSIISALNGHTESARQAQSVAQLLLEQAGQ